MVAWFFVQGLRVWVGVRVGNPPSLFHVSLRRRSLLGEFVCLCFTYVPLCWELYGLILISTFLSSNGPSVFKVRLHHYPMSPSAVPSVQTSTASYVHLGVMVSLICRSLDGMNPRSGLYSFYSTCLNGERDFFRLLPGPSSLSFHNAQFSFCQVSKRVERRLAAPGVG